jgi:hypothetical protein
MIINLSCNNDIQTSYNKWNKENIILNIPICIIFQINIKEQKININKKIKLFQEKHQYSKLRWSFNSLFYQINNSEYKTYIYKNNNIVSFTSNSFPCINIIKNFNLTNLQNKIIYVLYHKTPTI